MKIDAYELDPPSLEEIAAILEKALQANFTTASVSVAECPDLREEPFQLAAAGLSGHESIADIGGQPNLFLSPVLSARYSLMSMAEKMQLSKQFGMLIGAGAGPFFDIGVNSELAPNVSWKMDQEQTEPTITNLTHYTRINKDGSVSCKRTPSLNCALMMNLYGSDGLQGPVLKIQARNNKGGKSLTDYVRFSLQKHFGSERPISIGGVILMKKGIGYFHVMPDFPPDDQLPFKDPKQLNDWLTWHNFEAPMVCLTVIHTGDPGQNKGHNLGLRMEHTHCFAAHRNDQGGHYHHDIQGKGIEEVEYEAYLNVAKTLFRIDQPTTVLERDLHD